MISTLFLYEPKSFEGHTRPFIIWLFPAFPFLEFLLISCMILVSVLVYKAYLYSNKEQFMQLLTQQQNGSLWPQYITTIHASMQRKIGLCTACYNIFCLFKKCLVLGPEFLSSNPLHGEYTFGPTALPLWGLVARRINANILMFMMLLCMSI